MQLEFSPQILEKYSNIEFQENPSSGSRVVPCGQTDGGTDMTKPIVGFRNFEKTTKSKEQNRKKNTQTTSKNEVSLTLIVLMWRIG